MSALILVVDDEPDVADLFRQNFRKDLRAARFAMDFATSAQEALQKVESAGEDPELILILSDINMPGMSGLELLPVVRERRPELPVFMISAYGDTDAVASALARGANKFLTKPVDFPQLKQDVLDTLARMRGNA